MDTSGGTGAGRGARAPRRVMPVAVGKGREMGRLLRVVMLALLVATSLASAAPAAVAQGTNQQCWATASNEVWCQHQNEDPRFQYGLWMGTMSTVINHSVTKLDWYWSNGQQWIPWHSTYVDTRPTTADSSFYPGTAVVGGTTSGWTIDHSVYHGTAVVGGSTTAGSYTAPYNPYDTGTAVVGGSVRSPLEVWQACMSAWLVSGRGGSVFDTCGPHPAG